MQEKTKQAYINKVVTNCRATGKAIIRYEVRFRRRMPDGVTVDFQKRYDRADIARRERDRVLAEIAMGTYRPATKKDVEAETAPNVTVAEGLIKYIEYLKKISPFGLPARTETAIRALAAGALGQLELAALSGEHLDEYALSRKEQGVAQATIRKEVATVKRFRACAHEKIMGLGLVQKSLRTEIKLRHGEARTRRPQENELQEILEWLREHDQQTYWAGRLAVATACRQGELAKAKWQDFDGQRGVLWLAAEQTKTRRQRGVPLTSEALAILAEIPRKSELILGGAAAYRISVGWRRACKAVGVIGLRFHDLRREAISRAAEMGLGDRQLQIISGHTQATQLSAYTALSPAALGEQMRKIEAARTIS